MRHLPIALCIFFTLASRAWGGSAEYADMVLNDAPSIYLRFEEPSGTTATNSADWGGYDWTTGKNYLYSGSVGLQKQSPFADGSYAASFGGSACAYSDASSTDDTAQDVFVRDWTVEFWVRHTTLAEAKVIWSKQSTISFEFDASNNLFARNTASVGCTLTDTTTTITDTAWHHVAFVSDNGASTFTIYKDGAQVAQDATCAFYRFPTANYTTAIGSAAGDSCSLAAATELDELAVYAVPLSAARIAEHYAARRSCYLSSTGQLGSCTAGARGVLATDSSGVAAGFRREFRRTIDLGTTYAPDGSNCTAPTLAQIGGTGPRQWIGACTSSSGSMEYGLQLPAAYVPKSGIRLGGLLTSQNAAPAQQTLSVACSCSALGAEETTWADTSAFPAVRWKSSGQNHLAGFRLPANTCYPSCDPGEMLRIRIKPGTWTQAADDNILGFQVGLKLYPTGDF